MHRNEPRRRNYRLLVLALLGVWTALYFALWTIQSSSTTSLRDDEQQRRQNIRSQLAAQQHTTAFVLQEPYLFPIKKDTSNGEDQEDDNEDMHNIWPSVVLWPQTDHRIRRAVVQGERIGPAIRIASNDDDDDDDDSYPLATIVSMFYDLSTSSHSNNHNISSTGANHTTTTTTIISGKRLLSDYRRWIRNLLVSSTDPLVFFCESPTSEWADLVRRYRRHAPTILATLPLANLTMKANFHEFFWQRHSNNAVLQQPQPQQPQQPQISFSSSDTYKVWNEKIILVHEVSTVNPFATQHFAWLDAGYHRQQQQQLPPPPPQPDNNSSHNNNNNSSNNNSNNNSSNMHHHHHHYRRRWIRNNWTQNGLGADQILLQSVSLGPDYVVAGGAWGGTAVGIRTAYLRYFPNLLVFGTTTTIWPKKEVVRHTPE